MNKTRVFFHNHAALIRAIYQNKKFINQHKSLFSEGVWIIKPRFCYLKSEQDNPTVKLFFMIVPRGVFKNTTVGNIYNYLVNRMRVICTGNKTTNIEVSCMYKSRSGTAKLFDFKHRRVYSTLQASVATAIPSHKIFEYFCCTHKTQVEINNESFIEEELIDAEELKLLDEDELKETLPRLFTTYQRYVQSNYDNSGKDSVSNTVWNEVSPLLYDSNTRQTAVLEKQFKDIVSRTKFVESHLDFNIANILHSGESFWLLDNDNLGLSTPAFYDVLNIAFNQINYWNDPKLFTLFMSENVRPKLDDLLSNIIDNFTENDYPDVFFAYYIFLLSNYLRDKLEIHRSSAKLARSYLSTLREINKQYFPEEQYAHQE